MAESAIQDAKALNVTAETILQYVAEIDTAEDKLETAKGALRNVRKRAKADGVNLRMLDEIRHAKRRDADEVIQDEQDRLRYAAFLGLDLGTQMEMSLDVPAEDVAKREQYDARRDGLSFGRQGHPRTDTPFAHEPGSVAYAAWDSGWVEGEKEHSDGSAPAKPKRGRPKKAQGAEMGDHVGTAE